MYFISSVLFGRGMWWAEGCQGQARMGVPAAIRTALRAFYKDEF